MKKRREGWNEMECEGKNKACFKKEIINSLEKWVCVNWQFRLHRAVEYRKLVKWVEKTK